MLSKAGVKQILGAKFRDNNQEVRFASLVPADFFCLSEMIELGKKASFFLTVKACAEKLACKNCLF